MGLNCIGEMTSVTRYYVTLCHLAITFYVYDWQQLYIVLSIWFLWHFMISMAAVAWCVLLLWLSPQVSFERDLYNWCFDSVFLLHSLCNTLTFFVLCVLERARDFILFLAIGFCVVVVVSWKKKEKLLLLFPFFLNFDRIGGFSSSRSNNITRHSRGKTLHESISAPA